ncbi:PAP2 superfamily protein [Gemmobacter caeni]|uniref:PAP2 superfamily protein n=1 Tax=Gemmobacter caeni TaxID=589035 RepID=A0A2T6B926_9RHOB|nr:phosphatase PAP2 family protein [Gemmobacter caeni]PTX52559.1 PAP2 superfamily protein [Gemmobacter caeni]TWJ02770.1 PAP2 superfamily protein [Gemmobacter caeni]
MSICEKANRSDSRRRRLVACLFLVMSLAPSFGARASDEAEARFTEAMWGADLLLTLAAGPAVLPAGLDLGLPPVPSPQETRDELDRLQFVQTALRDEATRRLIAFEAETDAVSLLRDYGMIPAREAAPELWSLLEVTGTEAAWFTLRAKRESSRARPTQIRPSLGAVIPVPAHPSYPSGHAAQIYALAEVLGRIVPDCVPDYRRVAAGVAIRREIAGVHFPSDTRAGAHLAERVTSALFGRESVGGLLADAAPVQRAHVASYGCAPSAPDGTGGLR